MCAAQKRHGVCIVSQLLTQQILFHKSGLLVVYTETQGWLLRSVHFGTCSQKIVFYSFPGPIPWNTFVDTPKLISVWKGPSNMSQMSWVCSHMSFNWSFVTNVKTRAEEDWSASDKYRKYVHLCIVSLLIRQMKLLWDTLSRCLILSYSVQRLW